MYKVALVFDKGDVGVVSSGGKKVIEHYKSMARKLFIEIEDSKWSDTKDNVRLLGKSVKNRVTWYACSLPFFILLYYSFMFRIKKNYVKYRASISETGQGLIDADREDEILPGSEIANVWRRSLCSIPLSPVSVSIIQNNCFSVEKVQAKFPWYKRMHQLMGTSPVVSKAAIAHSRTPIDLTLLDRGAGGKVC